jgi:predicted transcriptional regulator
LITKSGRQIKAQIRQKPLKLHIQANKTLGKNMNDSSIHNQYLAEQKKKRHFPNHVTTYQCCIVQYFNPISGKSKKAFQKHKADTTHLTKIKRTGKGTSNLINFHKANYGHHIT